MERRVLHAVYHELLMLEAQVQDLILHARREAGQMACELIEHEDRQDCREMREEAVKTLGRAVGMEEVLELIRRRIPCVDPPRRRPGKEDQAFETKLVKQ